MWSHPEDPALSLMTGLKLKAGQKRPEKESGMFQKAAWCYRLMKIQHQSHANTDPAKYKQQN